MSIASNDDLLAALLAQQPRKRRGCVSSTIEFLCTVAVVALAVVGGWALLTMFLDTPAAAPTNTMLGGTPTVGVYTQTQRQQQPVYVPAPALPDCATVQDTTTACERGLVPIGTNSTSVETPTAAPTPTEQTGFWTQEEQAQFAATDEAFYNDIPTPEPTFVAFVNEACTDPTKVAQSKLLASWCGDE